MGEHTYRRGHLPPIPGDLSIPQFQGLEVTWFQEAWARPGKWHGTLPLWLALCRGEISDRRVREDAGRLLCQQRKGTREVTLNGLSAGHVGQRAATAGGRQGWPVNPPAGLPGETWVTLLNLNSRKAVNDLLRCVRSTYTKHYLD